MSAAGYRLHLVQQTPGFENPLLSSALMSIRLVSRYVRRSGSSMLVTSVRNPGEKPVATDNALSIVGFVQTPHVGVHSRLAPSLRETV